MPLNLLLQLPPFRGLYRRVQRADPGLAFSVRALDALEIAIDCGQQDIARIPEDGPLVIAANHPHGLLDGLVVAALVGRRRPDLRILTNRLAASIPELSRLCFFVDPFGGTTAERHSRGGLRQAVRWVASGGALAVFPAGEVAHLNPERETPVDGPWFPTAARLAAHANAPLLPVFIAGRNSSRFYTAGRFHPALRTALLPFELLARRNHRVTVAIGQAIPPEAALSSPHAMTRAARTACDQLGHRSLPAVVPPVEPSRLEQDVRALPASDRLLSLGDFEVFCAPAARLPHVLREIGRLREVTFRQVGEGAGTDIDLDRFDAWYEHLFVWRPASREIVGAYRIAPVDRVVAAHGVEGLYTHTLFDYDERLLRRLPTSLELGRSFVRIEYQKHSSALLLLWKGVGRVVARDPRCRVLFGPVSISRRYSDTSQQLLQQFLDQNHRRADLSELIRARNPMRPPERMRGFRPERMSTLDEVDRLVASLEADGKGIPVLLRQYLRLNAGLLGFNIDPDFGDVLDALMMVDLADVEPAILTRYFGRAEARRLQSLRDTTAAA